MINELGLDLKFMEIYDVIERISEVYKCDLKLLLDSNNESYGRNSLKVKVDISKEMFKNLINNSYKNEDYFYLGYVSKCKRGYSVKFNYNPNKIKWQKKNSLDVEGCIMYNYIKFLEGCLDYYFENGKIGSEKWELDNNEIIFTFKRRVKEKDLDRIKQNLVKSYYLVNDKYIDITNKNKLLNKEINRLKRIMRKRGVIDGYFKAR